MRYFADYLTAHGIPWTHDIEMTSAYDILFLNSWTIPFPKVLKAKRNNPKLRVVQRVDGAAQDYGRTDGVDWIQRDVNRLADLTIYQSQYSYNATHKRYHLIETPGPIIHNPVDVQRFSPDGECFDWKPKIRRVISVGWSPNPLKGNWRIPILAKANPDIEFVVVGRAAGLENLPGIRQIEYLDHERLPVALRSADMYLSLIENDACPNVILEALASGLPVLYIPSGGVPELVRDAGLPFAQDSEFAPQLERLFANHAEYAQKARQIALEHHQFDDVFSRYLKAIAACERRAMPPRKNIWQGNLDTVMFNAGEQARKWKRILTGKQSLRRPEPEHRF